MAADDRKIRGRLMAAEAAARPQFWRRVDLLGDCWEWTGLRSEWGYGRLSYGGHQFAAHRCSYEYAVGRLPEGMWVLHQCDNPPCVNPAHLFLGTAKDNTADMHAKGRAARLGARGEANRAARLTDDMVIQIRLDYASGTDTATLAEQFGFTREYIRLLVKGKAWPHVGGPILTTDGRSSRSGRKRAA